MRFTLLTILFLQILLTHQATCQNMVINSGFEEIWNCPYSLNQLKLVKSWIPAGTAEPSPDFFHRCAEAYSQMGVPLNIFGNEAPHSGDAYAGIICYLTSKSGKGWKLPANHREFVMTQLTKPLEKGKEYYCEFWVNLADNCEFAVDQLGMYITDKYVAYDWQLVELGRYQPQITQPTGKVVQKNNGWHKINGVYTALGGEVAITIGCFAADKELTIKKTKRKFSQGRDPQLPANAQPLIAYYYIDDVMVRPLDSRESIYPNSDSILVISSDHFPNAEIGKKFTLQHIHFELNQAKLLSGSLTELNRLLTFMETNNRVKIRIEGHTDNAGSRAYNLELSQRRADAVKNFLAAKGIEPVRIETVGLGSTQPIVPNTTHENRALNRRVEFEIIGN